jgi:hypothetical protein
MGEKTMLILSAVIALLYMGFMYQLFKSKQQAEED